MTNASSYNIDREALREYRKAKREGREPTSLQTQAARAYGRFKADTWREKNPDGWKKIARRAYANNAERRRASSVKRYAGLKDSPKFKAGVKAYYQKNGFKVAQARRATVDGRARQLLNSARDRARKTGVSFTIDLDFVKRALEPLVCSVSGISFVMDDFGRGHSPWAPSLDRIKPELGYVPENTRCVVWLFNRAKGEFTDADVLKLARAVVGSEPS